MKQSLCLYTGDTKFNLIIYGEMEKSKDFIPCYCIVEANAKQEQYTRYTN